VSSTHVSLRVVDGNGRELWATEKSSADGRRPYRLDWSPQGDLVLLDMDNREFWRIGVRQNYGFKQPMRLVLKSNTLHLLDSNWKITWGADIPVSGLHGVVAQVCDRFSSMLFAFSRCSGSAWSGAAT